MESYSREEEEDNDLRGTEKRRVGEGRARGENVW